MLEIKSFTFFPEAFGENTYVVSDSTLDCVVIDPGCYHRHEQADLLDYIQRKGLTPRLILNTHCHIDHVLGNAFIHRQFQVPLLAHRDDLYNLKGAEAFARMYGLSYDPSPEPDRLIQEGEVIEFGQSKLEVLFTPGHSAGHVSFFHRESRQIFSGDVLFYDSIGRTDLPGGNGPQLIQTIRTKLFPLGDDVRVYAGHMQPTTVGRERLHNPFLN